MSYRNVGPEELGTLPPGTRYVDVREPDEFTGPLGHLPQAELAPLGSVPHAARRWDPDVPLLLICRSGARSAQAAQLLAAMGFKHLFNLAGGMIAVNEQARTEGRC